MIQVTETMYNGEENRKICAAIAARLLSQDRHPEIIDEIKSGVHYIRVIDHSEPIFEKSGNNERRLVGFEC